MKKMLMVLLFLAVAASAAFAQGSYPKVTLSQLEFVSPDSLLLADSLQNNNARWTLQFGPNVNKTTFKGDTVTVTALCVVPAKVMTYTQKGWTMMLADTSSTPYPWGGLLVRIGAAVDTAQAITDGFLNVAAGDIITMTGLVSEFPASAMTSTTQFSPIPGKPITIIGGKKLPAPLKKKAGDFYKGVFSTGKIMFSTGEPLENTYVELTGLRATSVLNSTRGTFTMVDKEGNEISMYDASKFFTLKGTSVDHPAADTAWTRIFANIVLTPVDTIRGYITTVSGSEAPRGYRISPIYYKDLVLGKTIPPIVSTHRRNPVVVTPNDTAVVSIKAIPKTGGAAIKSVSLLYATGSSNTFSTIPMTYSAVDTTYAAIIPKQVTNTAVRYFVTAVDSVGISVSLANAGSASISSDTSKGFFFYTSLNRALTIKDIQYTPYSNGRSAYVGAVVTVGGIVTADTANIVLSPLNTGGTNAWYLQNGNTPWSGIWVTATTDTTLKTVKLGDSVMVTGTIQEQFDVTRIGSVATPVTIVSHANAVPAPVALKTGAFGPNSGNGAATAEPYESMLVTFTNVTVADIYPTYADPTEFSVDDGTGPVLVRRDGLNSYSNVPADSASGKTILRVGNKIGSLTGVMYYSFNRYKISPRKNSDYANVSFTSVQPVGNEIPKSIALEQNYPNPFNPSTTIEFSLPLSSMASLKIYNVLGQEVMTLVNEVKPAGRYTARFDASRLSSGMYFYRLSAGAFSQVRKMLLVK